MKGIERIEKILSLSKREIDEVFDERNKLIFKSADDYLAELFEQYHENTDFDAVYLKIVFDK